GAMGDEVVVDHAATKRYAVVTGANKGIGFEICKQLASKGITVILASRDEKRGIEARERLIKELGSEFGDYVVSQQLDVADPASVAALVDFIKTKFGSLDILVNNAGLNGTYMEGDASVLNDYVEAEFKTFQSGAAKTEPYHPKATGRLVETVEHAKECIETNYYGSKRVTEALIPLLQQSDSPRIVNVSSTLSSLVFQTNEWAKGVFSSEEGLTEEKLEEVLAEFLKDFIDGKQQEKQWPPHFSAYKVSKAALNAYTRIIAKKYPSFRINAVCPGYTKTDLSYGHGQFTDAEAAEAPVKLALLPQGGPSGCFFFRDEAFCLYLE
uniref:(-)-menthone:(+)-neomenthol reductase n=1 Tax=Mentha piperita TaxID=34256 RepID=UPI00084A2E83|nr:Chain A, (-)-menthone:(+)-neomenthol reductase [Mentha x piperita]5L53_A Chain A, (-)-menthone:(+)-neomenthol reductase [Mentha x piperita]